MPALEQLALHVRDNVDPDAASSEVIFYSASSSCNVWPPTQAYCLFWQAGALCIGCFCHGACACLDLQGYGKYSAQNLLGFACATLTTADADG